MKKIVLFALMLLLVPFVGADFMEDFEVPLSEKAFSRCGDGVRDSSESCDLGNQKQGILPGEDLCPEMGKILGIVQVCRSEECRCIIDRMDCGNGIREGAEWCDPGEETKDNPEENDLCPELSGLLGRNMTCNPDTCLCSAQDNLIENAVCGDGKIEYNEECENNSDCEHGKECKNCKCLIEIPEMNKTELDEMLNQSDIPEKKPEKKKEFDYHNLIGEDVPEFFYSDFRRAYSNVNVSLDSGSYIIGVRTKHNVIQEIIDGGYEEPDRIVKLKESAAKEIINSNNRTQALEDALREDKITYKPTGLFSRMWFWFKGLFR